MGIVLRSGSTKRTDSNPVDPAAKLELDARILQRFPEGYRHLAYLQTTIGHKVKPDMPGLKGPKWRRCMREAGAGWAGESVQA